MGFIDGTHYTESEIEAMQDDLIKSLLGFDAEDHQQQSSFYEESTTTNSTTTTTKTNSSKSSTTTESNGASSLSLLNDQNNHVLVNNQNIVNSNALRKGKELSPVPLNLVIDQTAVETLKSSYDSVVGFVLSHPSGVVINCPQCKHTTSHKQDMIDHINSKHIRFPAFECKSCPEKYFSKRKLKEHTKRKHEVVQTKGQNKRKLENPQPQPQSSQQPQPTPPPTQQHQQQHQHQHHQQQQQQQELTSQQSKEEENIEEKKLKMEEQEVKEEIKPSMDDKKQKIKLICPVCLSVPTKYASTLCGHVFCEPCIRKVAESLKSCPLCQKSLDSKSYHPLYLSF